MAIFAGSSLGWAQAVGSIEKLKVVPSGEILGKVYLIWDQAENVFYYNVYRDGKVIGRARDPFYVDKKATPGAKALYKIVATKGGKEGASSSGVSVTLPTVITLPKHTIEFRGDDIYVDDKKYLVCGIGYAPYRPFTSPNKPYPRDYDLIEKDFQLMREVGFNTIRNWSGRDLNEYIMELAHKYGFLILQGLSIWVPPLSDFADQSFQQNALSTVEDEMKINREHNNVLGYLVMNEPPPGKISAGGLKNTNEFYAKVVGKIKELQPGAYVSLANWPRADMIDANNWDFFCINHYGYDKSHVVNMGYRGYLHWLKRTLAKNKPLIGTEYGYSLSQRGEGNFGYGGNTEEEQAVGIVRDTYAMIAEKGNGACIFSWIDEWWKNNEGEGDEARHEVTEPEEWFGIVGITEEHNVAGKPRQAVAAMNVFYDALIVSPRDNWKVQGKAPIEIYSDGCALAKMEKMDFSLDGEEWQSLERDGNWWLGELDTAALSDGKYDVRVRYSLTEGKVVNTNQKVTIYVANNEAIPEQSLLIQTDKSACQNGETVAIKVKYAENGKPRAGVKVEYSVVQIGTITASCRILNSGDRLTDANGVITFNYLVKDELRPHFLTISASVPSAQKVGEKFSQRIVVEANPVAK